jgi:hypothetical protein
MLKATASGPGGSLVFLGLSYENLRRMRAGESIQFPAAEVGLGEGLFVLVHANDPMRAVVEQELGRAVSVAIVLHDSNHDDLRAGLALDLDLGPFRTGLRALVFAAPDEDALLRLVSEQGLVGPGTSIDDPDGVLAGAKEGAPYRSVPPQTRTPRTPPPPDDADAPERSFFDHVPAAACGVGAFASLWGAVERGHDVPLYVIGAILLGFAIFFALRPPASR